MDDVVGVPLNANDREQFLLLLRDPESCDRTWVQTLIVRYDLARAFATAQRDRPERVAFMCNPDESGGVETLR